MRPVVEHEVRLVGIAVDDLAIKGIRAQYLIRVVHQTEIGRLADATRRGRRDDRAGGIVDTTVPQAKRVAEFVRQRACDIAARTAWWHVAQPLDAVESTHRHQEVASRTGQIAPARVGKACCS